MRAATPPMGWNSWDSFGTTVTEDEVLANAKVMAERLLPHGWDTVVVDIAWYDPTARSHGYNADAPLTLDGFGRQMPSPNRFPSAADGAGFGPLAAQVHELGLKFGLHIMRGIPRHAVEQDLPVLGTEYTAKDVADLDHVCQWNPDNYGLDHDHPGAQAYYDAQVAQFAAWGVDFIKADDMQAPYYEREIAAYQLAIQRSGRDISLSLSPGTGLSTAHIDHLRENAQMWRISDDLWDRWEDLHAQFARLARWAPFQQAGGWADADMLPLGRIGIRAERGEPRHCRLTLDEQRAMLSLWCMARSPLMVGGDLPTSTEETLELLATPAVTEVLQGSVDGRELLREPLEGGELIVWSARSASSDRAYAAIFWTGEEPHEASVALSSILGIGHAEVTAADLWPGQTTAIADALLTATVPAHGVAWVALDAA
ncbi:glycoside hydrolase family 27 protein [Demequina mangrovi]|uniref:Alpha-galactosidase n=1 Tax=Demequina mangrovi TaxID=1043493 RepID=A0A1H6W6J2_9MICO|nr:glycoside hydrolase family 27 protein [Demequina mangrovi]SEJ10834.1 Alpha galactosidase A [Demequina mangrovi]